MPKFTNAEWARIMAAVEADGARFGLPARRDRSVVIGTFNALKLGSAAETARRWEFLTLVASRFDLLGVQEVMDELAGLDRLRASLDAGYDVIVSDTTGAAPGEAGLRERLAFLYRTTRFERRELVSDITYDRSRVVENLFRNREAWQTFFDRFAADAALATAAGADPPSLAERAHPAFLTFIRTPHCAALRLRSRNGAAPVEFLAVNAHMLFGKAKSERREEFEALLEWLVLRARASNRALDKNMILLGDLNMDFQSSQNPRNVVEDRLRALNKGVLSDAQSARVNFPLLSPHPATSSFLRTNARSTETFDHIALFIDPSETGLPRVPANATAGRSGPDGYDYGVFNYVELIAQTLNGASFNTLSTAQKTSIIDRVNDEISDHMPAWVRIPVPGA
jgi:hypothetical protein